MKDAVRLDKVEVHSLIVGSFEAPLDGRCFSTRNEVVMLYLQRWVLLSLLGLVVVAGLEVAHAQTSRPAMLTDFEKSEGKATVHPTKVMEFYRKLAKQSKWVRIVRAGEGDGGRPIHLVIVAKGGIANPSQLGNRVVVMTNNGIHSGESCGVDATQMLMRDVLREMKRSQRFDNVVWVTIPIYNVGGHIQWSPYNRVNQVGPVSMGFRGNARNYDLNRDFAKADTANARTFHKSFHTWKPHIFIDNHTTNGADYQHVMTYSLPPKESLPPSLQQLVYRHFKPQLEATMSKRKFPLIPYVVLRKAGQLKKGLIGFVSSPRYSTGYTRLFNTIPILSESHMLKTYRQRVLGTYQLNDVVLRWASRHAVQLRKAKEKANQFAAQRTTYPLRWKRTGKFTLIPFQGFAYRKKFNPVSGAHHVFYDKSKPRSWKIPFYNHSRPTVVLKAPPAYIIPQAWKGVIQRLRWSGVRMTRLKKDTTYTVDSLIMTQVSWSKKPYEGHVRPHSIKVEPVREARLFRKGDYIVATNQSSSAYIYEMLEPMARDSFVSWNFFDTIFQQKEYFNAYLFAPLAVEILKKDAKLRRIFLNRLRKEPAFAASPYRRLQFIYQSSKFYEPVHNRYPIARMIRK